MFGVAPSCLWRVCVAVSDLLFEHVVLLAVHVDCLLALCIADLSYQVIVKLCQFCSCPSEFSAQSRVHAQLSHFSACTACCLVIPCVFCRISVESSWHWFHSASHISDVSCKIWPIRCCCALVSGGSIGSYLKWRLLSVFFFNLTWWCQKLRLCELFKAEHISHAISCWQLPLLHWWWKWWVRCCPHLTFVIWWNAFFGKLVSLLIANILTLSVKAAVMCVCFFPPIEIYPLIE